ncbi:response regulator [Jeotgalibaca sp. MA1X17-3]|uniref:response regulator n=1 Tax=Jeotgalibaca sp. MA1X17-3 TaxID=2908211 RepID=UPI001F27703E|nr:response regulator [Jeotgalibaca sp. MA1X17-3]UJF16313.1 response regulator [Jeotgalibaca sp. MA1X17-3]
MIDHFKYQVLLVDDEEEIREGMAYKVPWEELGYQIVGTAENGMDALEIVEKEMPDIIITDIQMPYMDGLHLIEKAMKIVPNAKFIVFSGYDRFEYAQRAVTLQVTQYLLKPFSLVQFKESLTNLKRKMDEERENNRNLDILNQRFEENLPILSANFIVSCLNGSLSREITEQQAHNLSIKFINNRIVVLFQTSTNQYESYFSENQSLFVMALKNTMEKTFEENYPNISFLIGDQFAVVIHIEHTESIGQLVLAVNEICRSVKRLSNQDIVAGIGGLAGTLHDLKDSYREAQNALAYSYLLDQTELFATYIRDVEKDSSGGITLSENDERQFINILKYGTTEKINYLLDKQFQLLREYKLSASQYELYLMEHITLLLRITNMYHLNGEVVFGEHLMDFSIKSKNISLEKNEEWFRIKCHQINKKIRTETKNSGKSVIEKAKSYMKEQFHNQELSVEKIASELYLSPAYFSSLFKKEQGQSVVSYLTEQRLNEAVQLLKTTDEKTYIIAERVGYAEANYFSYVFKKKFGISPNNYRRQIQSH